MSAAPTPSQTVGPYGYIGLHWLDASQLVDPSSPGALRIEGKVTDGAGEAVPDAMVEIWQADPEGRFPPDTGSAWSGFGRCLTDDEGGFHFVTCKPAALSLAGGGTQAPHLEVLVFARGLLRHLLTRMYFPDEPSANSSDPLLSSIDDAGRRESLVARAEGGVLRFDIRLQGEGETVFFAP